MSTTTLQKSAKARSLSIIALAVSICTIFVLGLILLLNHLNQPTSSHAAAGVTYRYIKWQITKRRNTGTGCRHFGLETYCIQASEFKLLLNGSEVTWPGAGVDNPGGSWPAGTEVPWNMTDNDLSTKWLDWNFDTDGGDPQTGSSILLIDVGSGNSVTFDGYKWGTANDAPERDPISWNLYGSNNGTTWTLLDTRNDENITTNRQIYTSNYQLDTTPPTTPGMPSTTSPTTNQKPAWTWTASTDSGLGLSSTAPYTVEWSQDSSFVSSVYSSTATTNSFTHATNLADGTWYFRVKAQDGAGNFSTYSPTGSVVVDTTAPTVSYLVPADDSTGVSITPTFEIAFNEAVSTSSGYYFRIKKTSDNTVVQLISTNSSLVTASGTRAFIISPTTTLSYTTGYYITVDASAVKDQVNNNFAGLTTATAWNFTTTGFNQTPTGATLSNPTTSTLGASWLRGVGGNETYFSLALSTDGSTYTTVATTSSLAYTLSNLLQNTRYYFKVASADGISPTSSYAASSPRYTLAATPGSLGTLSTSNPSSVSFAFNSATLNSNPTTTTFIIKDTGSGSTSYLQSNGSWSTSPLALSYSQLGQGSTYSATGLTPNQLLTLSVAAVNGDGVTTTFGSSVSISTLAATPSAPTVSSPTTSTLSLTIPSDTNPAGTEYALYNATDHTFLAPSGVSNGSIPVWQATSTWGVNFAAIGLRHNTSYQFSSIARNRDGIRTSTSTLSEAVLTTGETSPPDIVQITSLSATGATVTWIPGEAKDETYFSVESSSDGVSYTQIATTTLSTTSYNVTGLTPNTRYYFRVTAANDVNASSFYTASPVYTLANTPRPPSALTSSATNTLAITIDTTSINGNPTATTNFIVKDAGPLIPQYLQTDGSWGVTSQNLTYQQLGNGLATTTRGLAANSYHNIKLAAVNGDGVTTAFSTDYTLYTLSDTPSDLALSFNDDNTRGTLSWSGNGSQYYVNGNFIRD
jgi:hypothetical protein